MKIKILSIVVVLALFLVACSPREYVLPLDSPESLAAGGGPVFVQIDNPTLSGELIKAITESVQACPLADAPEGLLTSLNLGADAQMRICDGYTGIGFASLMVVGVMEIPATLEPGLAGEATQGAVIVAGKIVAWIFLAGAVAVEAAIVMQQVAPIEDLILAASVEGLTRPAPEWDLPSVPQGAIDDLAREGSHALAKHAVARCILSVLKNGQEPMRVYFSPQAPDKKMLQPSLAFSWYLDKILRDMSGNLGECVGIDAQLMEEYGRIPSYSSVRLFLVVGLGSDGRYFTFSAYPVLEDMFNIQLCEWGYKTQLYPTLKRVNCPAGY